MRSQTLEFCKKFIYLDREPIRFEGRPYLPAIYGATDGNLVIRASRQVEKSTLLSNIIVSEAARRPGIKILYVCPRLDQASVFSHSRLLPALDQSPLVRRYLLGRRGRKPNVMNMRFANGSQVYLRAAYHTADAVRGISADVLLVDEFQDVAPGDLPVLQETLSHAKHGRTILTGTPKLLENHLEAMFARSTAHAWTVDCAGCGRAVILDERCLGPAGVVCPGCGDALNVVAGRWVPRNPAASWGQGFWVNHLMVPWIGYDDVLRRQCSYDAAKFKNEVLGLPTSLGEHVVTRAELEQCCGERPMATSMADISPLYGNRLVAGIDWGGGGTSRTVVVIGCLRDDYVFEVVYFARFRADEEPDDITLAVADVCRAFGVQVLAADGGGHGHVYNRLLLQRLELPHGMYAILYAAEGQQPRADGALMKWTVDRSATIGVLFSRIKKQKVVFPRLSDCGSFLEEFACEIVEYDNVNRRIRFMHPETMQDDALHATNYALQLALLGFQAMAIVEF